MKAGEGNPQAREEEGKPSLLTVYFRVVPGEGEN